MEIKKYGIEGMSCSACSSSVERVVRKLDGVVKADVNLLGKFMICEYDASKVDDEKIIWPTSGWDTAKGNIIGLNKEGKLLLLADSTGTAALEAGMVDGLEFGPFLIVNGKPLEIVGDPWGKSPRVAIGQRKDGVILFLVIDGENYIDGASLQDTIDVLMKYGAYNAANLDGGHSSSLSINGKLHNNPPSIAKKQGGRYVVTGFGLLK